MTRNIDFDDDFEFDSDNNVIIITGVGVNYELGLGKNLLNSIKKFEDTEQINVLSMTDENFLIQNPNYLLIATYYNSGSEGIKVKISKMLNGDNLSLRELN